MKFFILIFLALPYWSFSKTRAGSPISQLSTHSNVVVIQRRYLPRTARFELSPSLALFLSSEFIINTGVGGSLGFNILEKHGLEIRGFYTAVIDRRALVDLKKELKFFGSNDNFADKTESFVGLVYRWFPLYGKMSLLNRQIIPFETYLMLGGGMSRVICSGQSIRRNTSSIFGHCTLSAILGQNREVYKKWELTSIVGLGQSYSLSKNTAFRMDITHQYYGPIKAAHIDIVVSFAFSIFLPGAQLR